MRIFKFKLINQFACLIFEKLLLKCVYVCARARACVYIDIYQHLNSNLLINLFIIIFYKKLEKIFFILLLLYYLNNFYWFIIMRNDLIFYLYILLYF